MGRPTSYSDEIASELLATIATTRHGLAFICDLKESFPAPATVYRWMLADSEFCERYRRAKEDQLQVLEDELLQIADNTELGTMVTIKGDGTEERKMYDMIEHRKLRIESRKWLMGKLKPKKYGDKITHAGDADNPVDLVIHRVIASE